LWRYLELVTAVPVSVVDQGFFVEFMEPGGVVRRGSLATCWAVCFEDASPVRSFPSVRGQAHFPGLRWSATTGRHVGYESWLEREHAMLLDFDLEVVGYSSQPFWLRWHDGRRRRRHAPDFFARLADGTGVVVDVRADDRIEAKDAEAFAATAQACAEVGWQFRRVGSVDSVFAANVRWLAGYRHPRCYRSPIAARLLEVFSKPRALFDGAHVVEPGLGVLPVLYHLMWLRMLVTDLRSGSLGPASVLVVAGDAR
jgi:hypothetical protein